MYSSDVRNGQTPKGKATQPTRIAVRGLGFHLRQYQVFDFITTIGDGDNYEFT